MFPDDTMPSLRQTGYDIYVRAGLVEYLLEHPERAVGLLREGHSRSSPSGTSSWSRHDSHGHRAADRGGQVRQITHARDRPQRRPEGETDPDAGRRVSRRVKNGNDPLDLCTRVIKGAAPKASREQKSYAYFRRGRNHYLIQGMESFNPDAALKDYVTAVTIAPKAPWADKAMFLAANIFWNHKHNLDAAVSVWRRLIREYPKSKDADRSAFFIGTAFFFSKQYPEAEKALGQYIAKYPDSQFLADAKTLLDQCNAQTR